MPEQQIQQRHLLENLARALEVADADGTLSLTNAQRSHLRKTAARIREWLTPDKAAPSGYLTRSQFARLAQVSANTLVKWHAAGSLVPAYTHPRTHYRYYKPEQIAEVRHARQRKPRKSASL